MDYAALIREHRESGADCTMACVPVRADNPALFGVDGAGMGLVTMQADGEVVGFVEKPPRDELEKLRMVSHGATEDYPFLASMGMYVFKRELLHEVLGKPELLDFGADVLPYVQRRGYQIQ